MGGPALRADAPEMPIARGRAVRHIWPPARHQSAIKAALPGGINPATGVNSLYVDSDPPCSLNRPVALPDETQNLISDWGRETQIRLLPPPQKQVIQVRSIALVAPAPGAPPVRGPMGGERSWHARDSTPRARGGKAVRPMAAPAIQCWLGFIRKRKPEKYVYEKSARRGSTSTTVSAGSWMAPSLPTLQDGWGPRQQALAGAAASRLAATPLAAINTAHWRRQGLYVD